MSVTITNSPTLSAKVLAIIFPFEITFKSEFGRVLPAIRTSPSGFTRIVCKFKIIDSHIDQVMDGWRLKRLPKIDRDILRLAYVDINFFNTPFAVACDEAVNLANKYSDQQGRKFINGVLRRLQTVKLQ